MHSQTPEALLQVSPPAQVTPWQGLTLETQRFCALQVKPEAQEVEEHSQTPELALQSSPLPQLTPWQGLVKLRQRRVVASQTSPFWQEFGEVVHSQTLLVALQVSPERQVTPLQRALFTSQRLEVALQAWPMGQEPALHSHFPFAGEQVSPPAQLTPWQSGAHLRVVPSQRVVAAAAVQESAGSTAQEQKPLAASQLSPGTAQVTPAQLETQRPAELQRSPEGQEFGAEEQAHSPVAATQDSPAAQVTPLHFGSQRLWPLQRSVAEQEVALQAQAPEAPVQDSPGAQETPEHLLVQCLEVASQTAGATHEVAEHSHWPFVGEQLSPARQLTPVQTGTHLREAASHRVVGEAPPQVSAGSTPHSQAPVVALHDSPPVAQATPTQMSTQAPAAPHFLPAGQEFGDEVQAQVPVVSLQLSPGEQATPVHFGSQRLAALQRSFEEQEAAVHAQPPEAASQDSPAEQVVPAHLFTQCFDTLSQRAGGEQEVALQPQSPLSASHFSPTAQVTPAHRFTQRLVPGSQTAGEVQEVAVQEQTPVEGSHFSPAPQPPTVQRVVHFLVAVSQNLSVAQEVAVHSQMPLTPLQLSPLAQVVPAQRFSQRFEVALQVAGAGQEVAVQVQVPSAGLQVSPGRQETPAHLFWQWPVALQIEGEGQEVALQVQLPLMASQASPEGQLFPAQRSTTVAASAPASGPAAAGPGGVEEPQPTAKARESSSGRARRVIGLTLGLERNGSAVSPIRRD